MKYTVSCVIHTPKDKHIMKNLVVEASCDADAIQRAQERFNKYLSRVGYRVEVLFYDMLPDPAL